MNSASQPAATFGYCWPQQPPDSPGYEYPAYAEREYDGKDPVMCLRRVDFARIIAMDEKNQQAEQIKSARAANEDFIRQQKQRFRQRGAELRVQRQAAQTGIVGRAEISRQKAAEAGDQQRGRQAAQRLRRQQQDFDHEDHGRLLTEKYSTRDNQLLVRHLKEKIVAEREAKATEMKTTLKKLKKETDDGIYNANCERVRRVYAETAHPVVRKQKQKTYTARQAQAKDTRRNVQRWKIEKEINHLEHLDRAHAIIAVTPSASNPIVREWKENRQAEKAAVAQEMTQWRRDILEMAAEEAAKVRAQNRFQRDSVVSSMLIPEAEVVEGRRSPRGAGGEPDSWVPADLLSSSLSMLTRIFGVKKTRHEAPDNNWAQSVAVRGEDRDTSQYL